MYAIIAVPHQAEKAFADFADARLSRDLDWHLIYHVNWSDHGSIKATPGLDVIYNTILASHPEYLTRVLPGFRWGEENISHYLSYCSLWVFHITPVNMVDDVTAVLDTMHELGCYSNVTLFPPRRQDECVTL